MDKITKRGLIISICIYFSLIANILFAANYPLEITAPQESLNTNSRWYKAYPGLEYKVPVGVFGGTYPFNYELTTAPSGMAINGNTGVITWPNPTTSGSPHDVTVRVRDHEGSSDSHSWTITVTTSGFIFVDANAGDGGDGSISSPFNEMVDIYEGTNYNAMSSDSYDDYFIYWRGGTYGLQGYLNNSGQQYQMEWRGNYKPHVWLGYPGESVIIDHNYISGTNGAFLDWTDGNSTDAYFHNIKFQDMLNHAVRIVGNRVTFFDCEFYNLGPGLDGQNSSFIMFASTLGPGGSDYPFIKDCTFNSLNTGAFLKFYSTWYMVIDSNTFSNGSGSPLEGIALKAYDSYIDVRGNTINNIREHAISGNQNMARDIEIRFNKVLNANNDFNAGVHGALTVNYHDTAGRIYIYRNTFEGTVTVRFATSDDGPFHFSNNVIVNRNSGIPSGSHITNYSVQDQSRIIVESSPNNNLVGYPENGILDENGNLTSIYSSFVGTHGYQLGTEPMPMAPNNLRIISD